MNNVGGGGAGPSSGGYSHSGQYSAEGRYIGRGGHPPNVKVRRKCLEVACQPSVILLLSTVLMTAFATVLLSFSLTGHYWEMLTYDLDKVNEIVDNNRTFFSVKYLINDRVPVITYNENSPNVVIGGGIAGVNSYTSDASPQIRYLVPLHSGVWISCIDLEEPDFKDLQQLGYNKVNKCVDHLDPDNPKPTDARGSWQHRMQNLAIACALVCLILLGAAIVVGLFGVLRPQISAVLVTGVIYVLSATFATFTLTIVHFKHKNRNDCDPLDVWTRLIPELVSNNDFRTARVISHGWSLQLAWAGTIVCVLASIMWILLSKMMRYNPISLTI